MPETATELALTQIFSEVLRLERWAPLPTSCNWARTRSSYSKSPRAQTEAD